MVNTEFFYNSLVKKGVDFYSGVPDSLLQDICAFITDNAPKSNHIIAANEGNAIGLAAGYHMATGKIPMVYMQNSGLGNVVNPLLSLTDEKVYKIPLLLMIGWRGEPGVKDEPQHVTQGELTLGLLETMKIPYKILSPEQAEAEEQINQIISEIESSGTPHALIIRKGTFEKYSIKSPVKSNYEMTREQAIEIIVNELTDNDIIVSTTGKTSRELFEIREAKGQTHSADFLTVGSMGHASQIALGIAIAKPQRTVLCIDGDGALLMHMGSLAINGAMKAENVIHIVINNGAHESVGGQPTVGFNIDVPAIAKANGYSSAMSIETSEELQKVAKTIHNIKGPVLIEIKTKTGSRDDLGRPTISPVDNKTDFMKNLQN